MKIIHVAGRSGSGKTRLIKTMIPALAKKGAVGIVKHLGHHTYDLAEGKDTTEFFSSGAAVAVGIDDQKSVATIRTTDLGSVLRLLLLQGMDFVIIEGFKAQPFPKIVVGDFDAENCVLRDPSVQEILENLDRFETYRLPAEKPGNAR